MDAWMDGWLDITCVSYLVVVTETTCSAIASTALDISMVRIAMMMMVVVVDLGQQFSGQPPPPVTHEHNYLHFRLVHNEQVMQVCTDWMTN